MDIFEKDKVVDVVVEEKEKVFMSVLKEIFFFKEFFVSKE